MMAVIEKTKKSVDLSPRELLDLAVEYAQEKKARDLVALEVGSLVAYTDYFFLATGGTPRQVKAIHDSIYQGLKVSNGRTPKQVDGLTKSEWVVMDYVDVVIHIFTPELREFYALDQLWGEVKAIKFAAEPD